MSQTIVFTKTVELSDSDIKALPTAPFEILPAPGDGLAINVLQVFTDPNFTAAGYTNISGNNTYLTPVYGDDIEIFGYLGNANGGNQQLTNNFLNQINLRTRTIFQVLPNTNGFAGGGIAQNTRNGLNNQPVKLMFYNDSNGNLTGGNASNTLKVTVIYTITEI